MEEYKNPTCELELEHLIGRRAYDRRNNLKIDIRIHYIELKFLLPFEELVDATVGATVEGAVGLPVDCSTIG